MSRSVRRRLDKCGQVRAVGVGAWSVVAQPARFRIAKEYGLSYPQCVTQMKDFEKTRWTRRVCSPKTVLSTRPCATANVELMGQVWSQSAQVSCIHPGWQPLHGRETVMASWETILQHNLPAIYPQAASVHLWGDTALVICEESFREGRLVATNILCAGR